MYDVCLWSYVHVRTYTDIFEGTVIQIIPAYCDHLRLPCTCISIAYHYHLVHFADMGVATFIVLQFAVEHGFASNFFVPERAFWGSMFPHANKALTSAREERCCTICCAHDSQ